MDRNSNRGGFITTFHDSSIATIVIEPEWLEQAKEFADKRYDTSASLYKFRGELNSEKIKEDVITGVLGEFAVHQYLATKGLQCSMPDLNIYPASQKSFSADLICGKDQIHVKAQTVKSATRYGASWLFQKQDKLLALPSESKYIAFCIVDTDCVHIIAITDCISLVESNAIDVPKIPRYQATKTAIYLHGLRSSGIKLNSL